MAAKEEETKEAECSEAKETKRSEAEEVKCSEAEENDQEIKTKKAGCFEVSEWSENELSFVLYSHHVYKDSIFMFFVLLVKWSFLNESFHVLNKNSVSKNFILPIVQKIACKNHILPIVQKQQFKNRMRKNLYYGEYKKISFYL